MYVHSTLALRRQSKVIHPTIAQANKHTLYIARNTWMPSLKNWGGGLKFIYFLASHVHVHVNTITTYMYMYM